MLSVFVCLLLKALKGQSRAKVRGQRLTHWKRWGQRSHWFCVTVWLRDVFAFMFVCPCSPGWGGSWNPIIYLSITTWINESRRYEMHSGLYQLPGTQTSAWKSCFEIRTLHTLNWINTSWNNWLSDRWVTMWVSKNKIGSSWPWEAQSRLQA